MTNSKKWRIAMIGVLLCLGAATPASVVSVGTTASAWDKTAASSGTATNTTASTANNRGSTSGFNAYRIAYNAQIVLRPSGFVQHHTTFMPMSDVVNLLSLMNIHYNWNRGNLIIGNPLPVDVHAHPDSIAVIYVNGRQDELAPVINVPDATTNQPTLYVSIWYVMQALNHLGQKNSWNGHTWFLGHLFA